MTRLAHPNSPFSDAHVAAVLTELVAGACGLERSALTGRQRDPQAGRGRQVLFYLAHIGLGWSLDRVGRAFDRRRSTISYACRQVEDWRERQEVDRSLDALEDVAQRVAALGRADLGSGPVKRLAAQGRG